MKKLYFVISFCLINVINIHSESYEEFNSFCVKNFQPVTEDEYGIFFGEQLFLKNLEIFTSENSAFICFETSLPSKSFVWYGKTEEYDIQTDTSERFFFLHLHYLTDLEPGNSYHFQIVIENEDGTALESSDSVIITENLIDAVRIPEDIEGVMPYLLDDDNSYYLLTQDLNATSTAFNISGQNITLDLNGHTISYNNVEGSPDPIPDAHNVDDTWGQGASDGRQGPCGIRISNGSSVKICNGIIKQGIAKGGNGFYYGYNPIYGRRPRNTEVIGITAEYEGAHVSGLIFDSGYEGIEIKNNVFIDKGTGIDDRHQGCDAINVSLSRDLTERTNIHHNLIKRVRHRGIRAVTGTNIFSNETL